MVQIIEGNPSIAGRLGAGFGKGLAEQLPKEIERSRLSSGLRDLGKKDLSGKNQLEILADIQSIPGISDRPELAALAHQQLAKQNYQQQRIGNNGVSRGVKPPSENSGNQANVQQKAPGQVRSLSKGDLATPEQIEQMRQNRIQEPKYEDVFSLSNEILDSGVTQDPRIAEEMARSRISQDIQAQENRISKFKNDANERIKLDLQGSGLGDYKDVAGEIQKNLLDQGEYLVSQGMSPEAASQQIGDIARELGKISNNTKDTGSFWNMFRSASTKTQELREQRKEFEKYGFGEQFDDIAAAQLGITPLQAAHELDPIKNKAIKEQLSKLKKQPGPMLRELGNVGRKMDPSSLDAIIRKITPKDNLFSIEYELRDKGYDVNQFKQRVSELADEKELALTAQQKRQQKRDVGNQFFGDILYQTF